VRGGETSTSSTFKGWPAPQQTAALHFIVLLTVDMGGGIVESSNVSCLLITDAEDPPKHHVMCRMD
jgi:hypothetical protein